MNPQHEILENRINQVCRRWQNLILLKGTAQVLLAIVSAVLIAFALDAIFELSNTIRLFLLIAIVALTMVVLYMEIIHPLIKSPSNKQLARYIEEKHPELEDRLVSAVELGGAKNPRISSQILEKLLDDTRFHIAPINLPKDIRTKSTMVWTSLALAVSVFLSAFLISNIDFFSIKSHRLFAPWTIPTINLQPTLLVNPGNTRVPRGSAQEITAEITGFEAEEVALYYTADDSIWIKMTMDRTEQKGIYVFHFFDLQNQTQYYVKADDKLSKIFNMTLYDAPQIKRVDLVYNYPKYTGLKRKKETDTGDVWAPKGTVVKITAVADKPLREGQMIMGEGKKLNTSITADTLITTTFTVREDTYYKILITDNDDLSNHPPPEYFVHALPDQPPVLTIETPGRDIKASMVEETPIKIQVQDDYGLSSLKLLYTVNGVEEKAVNLSLDRSPNNQKEVTFNEIQEFSARHMFYLEDLQVQPGDFLTYYVKAEDNSGLKSKEPVLSEIFFIEIRPFEQQFFRPLSQSPGQMPGGSQNLGGRLSQTQKEIIIATWKLLNRRAKLNADELGGNIDVLVESQKNLLEVTQNALFQMEQRSLFSRDSGNDVAKFYTDAIKAMERAVNELSGKQIKAALTPERESLQNLLRAEAQITEVQMQRAQAQGGGNRAALDELARLFDDELDKLKNKYETPRQNQQHQKDEVINEALVKVKELARRQQQLNKKTRDLTQKNLSPEEKKRQIQELRRQQEQMRRETEKLARQMQNQQQNSKIPREIQDNLKRATSDMNNASNNLRQKNTELAAAKGQRALNRLKRLEDILKRNQKESLRQQIDSIEQDFQRLADAQKKLTQDVENLANEKEKSPEKQSLAQEDQNRLKEDFTDAQDQIKFLSNNAKKTRHDVSRELNKFSQELQNAKIDKKMESAEQLIKENRLNSALQAERDIKNMLERMHDKFTQLRSVLAETDEEKLDLALNQTRRLRENIEGIKRQIENFKKTGDEQKQGGAPKTEEQNSQNMQSGPGKGKTPPQKLDSDKLDWLNNELAESSKAMDVIKQSTRADTSLSRQASKLNQNMQSVIRTFTGGDRNRLKIIEDLVLIPLKGFEAELAQKLELIKNKEKLFLAREEKIPPEYEELVEKYYEALSKIKKK